MFRLKKYLFLTIVLVLLSVSLRSQVETVITYNIRYDNDWDIENGWEKRRQSLTKLLANYQPGILGIQEGLFNQVVYLDSCLLSYDYVGVGREDGKEKGEYCAIFYDTNKYKVSNSKTIWLSKTPDAVSVGWDAALERICTYGLFQNLATNERIWVLNTHFDHQGKKARKKSANLIIELVNKINKKEYPLVLMGDFNLTPDETPIKILSRKLNDALAISKQSMNGPKGTFNGFSDEKIMKRIDYIFTNNIEVISYSHINERMENSRHISDHLPVMISFKTTEK